jgi:hypothetical protein
VDSSKYDIDEVTGCWNFKGSKTAKGYGKMRVNYKYWLAHRYSLTLYLGRPINSGMVVMHICDNPSCVNPLHLSEGTQRDNQLDCIGKGRGGNRGAGYHSGITKLSSSERIERNRRELRAKVINAISRGWSNSAISRRFTVTDTWINGLRADCVPSLK